MNSPLTTTGMFSNIITNPVAVFESIKLKTNFMMPLLINILVGGLMLYMYYQQVDATWFVDHLIAISGDDLAPDQIKQMHKLLKPENMMIFGVIGAVITIIVMLLVQALYLLIAGNIKNIDISFSEWFSLASWSSVPGILMGLMIILNLLSGDNSQLAPELINPLNFATLLGIEGPSNFYNLMAGLSIITFWSIYLVIVGYRHWSQSSWSAATIIVSLPYIVIWSAQFFIL